MKILSLNLNFQRNDFFLRAKLDLELYGITIISGPSGVGKTSLLRCIAGLEKKCKGIIKFEDQEWQNSDKKIFMPTHQRKIGYIFQESFLFPNLNVIENIYYGEKRKCSKFLDSNAIIEKLKIGHLKSKKVFELSGGEKQKVAFARTLANAPKLILMDEPLNSIDESSKEEIISFLNNIKEQFKIPIIFVTHNNIEKEKLSDAELILEKGVLYKNLNKNIYSESLSPTQDLNYFKRYQKQICLKEFGINGQKALQKAKILCVGAGGLGSPVCLYLAAAGIGQIGIVENDQVELSNLHRQILYQSLNIGKEKAECAFEKIKGLNPEIKVELFKTKIIASNAEQIVGKYNIIVDCSDNFSTNYLLADISVKLKKHLVYSSINGFNGQISTFSGKKYACFRCLFKDFPKHYFPNCNSTGILGPACGILGSMQALQAIYLALGEEHCENNNLKILYNQILLLDLKNLSMTSFNFQKNEHCYLCSKQTDEITIVDYQENCVIDENIPELYFHEIEDKSEYTIIDVRDENEYELSHIQNSINIPLSFLKANVDKLSINKDAPIIIYCQGNRRSALAIKILKAEGYNYLLKIKGGYEGNFE